METCSGSIHTFPSSSATPRCPRCCLFSSKKYSRASMGMRTALGRSPLRSVASSDSTVSRRTTTGSIHPSCILLQAMGCGGAKPTTHARLSVRTWPEALAPTSIRLQPPKAGRPSAKLDNPGNPNWWPKNLASKPLRPARPLRLGDSGKNHACAISAPPTVSGPPLKRAKSLSDRKTERMSFSWPVS